jgi:hypothetical protein
MKIIVKNPWPYHNKKLNSVNKYKKQVCFSKYPAGNFQFLQSFLFIYKNAVYRINKIPNQPG